MVQTFLEVVTTSFLLTTESSMSIKTQVQRILEVKQDRANPPHLIIQARAGTGKTTTLIEGLKLLIGEKPKIKPSKQQKEIWDQLLLSKGAKFICFCAFNSSIADELKRRVPPGVTACTMHSLGNRSIIKVFQYPKFLKDGKTKKIVMDLLNLEDEKEIYRKHPGLLQSIKGLVSILKLSMDEPTQENLDEISFFYEIDINPYQREMIFEMIPAVLEKSKDVAAYGYDYDDMIYLPLSLNLTLPSFDLLLVDEGQDLNHCQQELALRVGKRIVVVGDDKQAIYGFMGADTESLFRMEKKLDGFLGKPCKVKHLTVTRRCGKQIVERAKTLVPDFEAHESNGKGVVCDSLVFTQRNFRSEVKPGDMVLSRTNAPLISEYFFFLKNKIPVKINGKNIGDGFLALIKKLKPFDIADLISALDRWGKSEIEKEKAREEPNEIKISIILEKVECLQTIIKDCDNLQEVNEKIENMFSNVFLKDCILLSSIHKAKGLEANTVYLLQYEGKEVPHPAAKSPHQKEQEKNLLYVAITRAIERLVFVYGRPES